MPGNRVEGLFDAYVRVVETGEPWTHEAIYRHEGLDIYIRLVAAKANDGFAVSFADLSERRRAEERMRESEERFRTLADSMPQLIWTARADGSVDYLSQQWAAYIGLSPEQLYNWGWEQVVHPDDLPGTRRVWGQSIQTGTPVEVRHRFRHVSGAWRWQLVRGIPLYDAVGQVRRWVGTCTDVHESETREQDARFLADISERIRVADDTEPLLLLIAQELGRYLEVQRCFFAEIFEAEDRWVVHHDYHEGVPSIMGTYPLSAYNLGTRQEVAAGRTIIVTDAETDPRCSAAYEQAYRPLAVNAHVVVPLLREGAWVSTLIVTCDGPRGWQDREVALLESVTERTWNTLEKLRAIEALQASEARLQELYAQEQAARAQAEEASRLKDEFLATVSHELRTPLTALIGYLGLLQTRRYDEAYLTRTLEKLMRSAQAQAELIDDLLDVSRIVNGRLGIDPQPIEFIPVIRGALDTVRPALEARGLALRVELDPTASRIVGDPNRLQQVVWNLLSNAVKFTPTGGLISVSLAAHEGAALLTVRDTGQGIRADFLPFVFERFRQADGTSTRSYNGLGLGLALVRHLVELHGGSVAATSAGEGQGATFTVRLPLETVPALPEPGVTHARPSVASSPTPLRGLRVLVVDDQPDLLELLDETLTLAGATVIRCDEAVGALDELQRVRPDLLITDLAMPDRDGYWLIEQVRALPAEHGGLTPAIALTAYARIGERRRLLTAGFQEYVPKPVNPAELLAIVERLARAEP
jgi:PAS domain S-box-containing protein